MKKNMNWKEMPEGNLIDKPWTSKDYKTGSWRAFRPIWIKENCINCRQCWLFCPDFSVNIKDGKMAGFDYDFCKGCGICARICPAKKKAIEMIEEAEAKEKEEKKDKETQGAKR